ncbi:MAG: hypothetical protein MUC91_08155 [Verrucomicrobia bacterium]|nr:hypothetical protein [Verrucomicrobiota bacterium]
MKTLSFMVLLGLLAGQTGCSSLFHDPLKDAYVSGQISREEFKQQSEVIEQDLARTSPAFWERDHAAEVNRTELTPQ